MDDPDQPTCVQDCYRMYIKDILTCSAMLDEGVDFPIFAECMFRAVFEGANCIVYCPPEPTA